MTLEVRGLSAGYGDAAVLHGVSLGTAPGRIVALLGANGAGKTTLLNAVSGLAATVRSGSVSLDGQEISRLPPHARVALGLSHVPQGRQLFAFMSVRENLEMGAYPPGAAARRASSLETVLDIFPRLRERLRQNAGSLSGGEQQMCAIARGLMLQPRYLLLDEPSLGLAPIIVKQVMSVVRDVAARGIGVLLVEQNVRQALRLADHAHVLEHGSIVLDGTAAALAADDRVRRAYLGL